jgi:fatty-acyl-CoA synthase
MFNQADLWERVAALDPDADALLHGELVRSWGEFEDRSARLAAAFAAHGVGPGDKVANYLHNGPEYLESEFAAFKQRAIPCNVNYRYLTDELRYLLDNADAAVVVADADLVPRVLEVRAELPALRLVVQVGEGDAPAGVERYEDLLAAHDPAPPIERRTDDHWFLYTGGTTGHPKAVMWPHSALINAMSGEYAAQKRDLPQNVEDALDVVRSVRDRGRTDRVMAAAPLMHGTSSIIAKRTFCFGGAVATMPERSFDPALLFDAVGRQRITRLTVVGDAFCKPMIAELDQCRDAGNPHDLSSLRQIVSSGLMWSSESKQALLGHADITLIDTLGASEGVGFGVQVSKRDTVQTERTAKFVLGPNAAVVREDGTPVERGGGEVGKLAVGGVLPDGYYKDPEKTAATYPVINGTRWAIPGDFATVEEDGTINLLGRGSVSINSGGEKIFPEEVEEALKLHPAVLDANAVGVPDDRWGQAVCGVISVDPTADVDDEDLIAAVKTHIAPYKAPKQIVRVDEFVRSPNGKSDYRWAKQAALDALGLD